MKNEREVNSRRRLIPIAPDGWRFVLGFGAAGAVFLFILGWAGYALGGLFIGLALFSAYFFRDGERRAPDTQDLVSPADGRVLEIADIDGEDFGRGRVIRIFLSVLDGHVQRAPASGRVVRTLYRPGSFLDARHPRAPFENEANAIELETPRGRVMVRQIAGLIARRVLCWIRPEDTVASGERIGLIRFGSQVDLYVPPEVEIAVQVGDRVRGGETVVARWPAVFSGAPRIPGKSEEVRA